MTTIEKDTIAKPETSTKPVLLELVLNDLKTIRWYFKKPNLKVLMKTSVGEFEIKKGEFLQTLELQFLDQDTLATPLTINKQGNIVVTS